MFRKISITTVSRILISSLIIVGSLCLLISAPAEAWAADVNLSLNPSRGYVGDSIAASGTADAQVWVTIKILDSEGNIVYFNPTMADADGNYIITFRIPDVSPGDLQVVAGYGTSVANENLTVKRSSRSSGEDDLSDGKTSDDLALEKALENQEEVRLDLSNSKEQKSQLSPASIEKLINSGKALNIELLGMKLGFKAGSLNVKEVEGAKETEDALAELGAKEVSADKEAEFLDGGQLGQSMGLIEIGGKFFELIAQIQIPNADGSFRTERIEEFMEPVEVTMDLSYLGDLTPEGIDRLTGVRFDKNEDGSIQPVLLGGTYDPVNKTFTFTTEKFSYFEVMMNNELIQIKLSIDKQEITVNGQIKRVDTPPVLIDSRTMVPLRFIGENLGAEIAWQEETKTVVIQQDGKVIELVIGQTGTEIDVPATIINDRTMVPIRYVSENLGADVTWFPSTKSVEIVK
ncbi:hypothetical protein JR334_07355 [Clostridia bacterium]|nr:hypothetical protein JR334_07355 [Clostridia bacterium]